MAFVVVAHFDPHLAGRHLAAIGGADNCFCHLYLLQSDHSIQGSYINNTGFLSRLLLAADGELIISYLNPYRFFPQCWQLIRNHPDALSFDFSTIMTATGLNDLESLLSINVIN